MSSSKIKTLGLFIKPTIFDTGIGANLPEAYKKFYKEWKLTEPTAVHYIPEEGRWKRDEVTGEVNPIQNVPLPLKFPQDHDNQIWGGEGIVQGFIKRHKVYKRRVPHFWMPLLKRSVVYSEVLDKHISVVLTNRTIGLIHSNFGFDHYVLKTPACDLRSLLPLGLKRKILQEIQNGCQSHAGNPEKQKDILRKYGQYLSSYTPEEIEWYGYSFNEACKKYRESVEENQEPIPLKAVYRSELIEKLKAAGIKEAEDAALKVEETSWIDKINPFSKKNETEK